MISISKLEIQRKRIDPILHPMLQQEIRISFTDGRAVNGIMVAYGPFVIVLQTSTDPHMIVYKHAIRHITLKEVKESHERKS